jgi:hypothetical protein
MEIQNKIQRGGSKMSNYSKEEALKFLKDKYEICIKLKQFDKAKEYLIKIKEIENEI